MGGGVRVALPTRMLDGCAPSATFSQSGRGSRFWTRTIAPAPRALPRGFADDEIPALLDRLFHPEASDAGYFHAGNPAERVARDARARAPP